MAGISFCACFLVITDNQLKKKFLKLHILRHKIIWVVFTHMSQKIVPILPPIMCQKKPQDFLLTILTLFLLIRKGLFYFFFFWFIFRAILASAAQPMLNKLSSPVNPDQPLGFPINFVLHTKIICLARNLKFSSSLKAVFWT